MQIKAVLFDLDGTLLPMDQDTFVKAYFGGISRRLAPHGYDPKLLVDAIWKGTGAMVQNDGKKTNEAVFWDTFAALLGEQSRADLPLFDAFYREDFDKVQASCGYNARAREVIDLVHKKGLRVALATNPIFPAVATQSRVRWAGLSIEDFEWITTYENSRYCKPNLAYYRDILAQMQLDPTECVMVGNDVGEDMIAEKLGMRVFLVTDCLINKSGADLALYPHGDMGDLLSFIEGL